LLCPFFNDAFTLPPRLRASHPSISFLLPPSPSSLLLTSQGLVLLSLLPAIGLLTHFQRLYHKSVLRREILLTFLHTLILLSPLVILENFFSWGAVIQTKIASEAAKKGGAEWGYRVLFGFVQVREEGREGGREEEGLCMF